MTLMPKSSLSAALWDPGANSKTVSSLWQT